MRALHVQSAIVGAMISSFAVVFPVEAQTLGYGIFSGVPAALPQPDFSNCDFNLRPLSGNIWYVDPVNGQTENAYTTAGISMNPNVTPHQGDSGHPWNSLQAVFGASTGAPVTGYAHILLASGKTHPGPIVGGDEVLLMNGTAAQYGAIGVGVFDYTMNNSSYVTIAAAPGQTPVLTNLVVENVEYLAFVGITIQSKTVFQNHLLLTGSNEGTFKNVIFDHMSISSTDYATAATYTTMADWSTNVLPVGGAGFGAVACTKLSNSHIFLVSGGVQMTFPNQLLIQNNEVDNFVNDGIDFEGHNVIIQGNYIHDTINIGGHIDGMQGDGNEPFNSNILIDSNTVIQTTTPTKPFVNVSIGYNGAIDSTNNAWSLVTVTNNLIAGQYWITGISFAGCWDCMISNNTDPDGVVRCYPSNGLRPTIINNNLVALLDARLSVSPRNADPASCLFANNVVTFSGQSSSFNCNGVTYDETFPGTYACGNIIDSGGIPSEITTFNNNSTYVYNFNLLSTAPARGAGTATFPTPQIDEAGHKMNSPPDVGALQFQ